MITQHFTIEIRAPKQRVWDVMLQDATYRQWTAAFHQGSYFEGSWDKGSKILFLGPNDDGSVGGMVSKIAESRLHEYVSIEHLGEVVNGVEDTTSDRAQQWAGAHENYSFRETNGVTTLKVDLESKDGEGNKEMFDMFEDMWPKALQKLKEIVEQDTAVKE